MAEQAEKCAACDTGPVLSFQSCTMSGCGRALHGWLMCDKVWMPHDNVYFCMESCLQKHNLNIVQEFESIPRRRTGRTTARRSCR
jgi:hypothetical protein